VEKIEQTNPDDPEDEVQPAQGHHFVGVRRVQKNKMRPPFRERNREEIEKHACTSQLSWIGSRKHRSESCNASSNGGPLASATGVVCYHSNRSGGRLRSIGHWELRHRTCTSPQ